MHFLFSNSLPSVCVSGPEELHRLAGDGKKSELCMHVQFHLNVCLLCVCMDVPPRFGQKCQLKVDKQQTSDVTGKVCAAEAFYRLTSKSSSQHHQQQQQQ